MTDTVWLCMPSISAGYTNPYSNSFVGTPQQKEAHDWSDRNKVGEALPGNCFPTEIFATKPHRGTAPKLAHLFSDASFWVVSQEVAAIFQGFDLGAASLYPVRVTQMDRQTLIGNGWFCLNFGNRKSGIIVERSVRLRDTYVHGGAKAFTPPAALKDDDLLFKASVLDGPDIWIDPLLADTFLLSDRLAMALKKAKLDKSFCMHRCIVTDPA